MENLLAKTGGISDVRVEVPDPPKPSGYQTLIDAFGGIPGMGGEAVGTPTVVPSPSGPLPEQDDGLRLVIIPPNPLTGEGESAMLMPKAIIEMFGL